MAGQAQKNPGPHKHYRSSLPVASSAMASLSVGSIIKVLGIVHAEKSQLFIYAVRNHGAGVYFVGKYATDFRELNFSKNRCNL